MTLKFLAPDEKESWKWIVHLAVRVSLSSNNRHDIPDGFKLTAVCGKVDDDQNELDFALTERDEKRCPVCFP